MSLISMISSMSSMVSQIGPGFKVAGTMAIEAFKSVIKWFKDNVITPIKEKISGLSWESLKTKAEETWESIKALVDEKLGALWDSLPDMPEALTWDYYFGEGGVFDWDLDWEGWFDFELPEELTFDHYFGEGGVFDWDIDYDALFDFSLPDELTYDHYFGEDGVFDWDIDYDGLFDFSLPDELTYDHYFGEGGVFDWDINWSGLFDFSLPDELTYSYWFGEGGVFDWDLSSVFDFDAWTDLLPDWSWSDIIPDSLSNFFSMENIENAFTGISDAMGKAANFFIEPIREGINSLIIDNLNKMMGAEIPYTGISLQSLTGIKDIPHLAKGGIVNKPTLAMIGEDGPEAVVPLTQRNNPQGAGMGGGTFNITVNAGGITDRTDKRTLAREIGNMIQQEMARNIGGTTMRGRY
tara:strand:- start:142 stop:1368 length:1227 start_codon:yes stop_codon:yes gene_type:complete